MSRQRPVVVVVGAGAAGTLVSAGLLDSPDGPRVVLVDPDATDGGGVAYGAAHASHLLNVPAGRMSARTDDPDDFLRRLRAEYDADADAGTFPPRREFGRYLAGHLHRARRAGTDLRRVTDRVTDVVRDRDRLTVRLRTSAAVRADAVVLATGVLPPPLTWAPDALRDSSRFVADPWAPGGLGSVPADGDVLLVGTGLTMVDVAGVLSGPGRTVHAVSRSGLLPRRHARTPQPPRSPVDLPVGAGLEALRHAVRRHVADAVREVGDWRPAWDGLRPHTQRLWASLSDADRARFLAEDARTWDVHRHRMAPAVADHLAGLRRDGRLHVSAGRVTAVAGDRDGLDVTLADGRCLRVAAVVNCTGSGTDPAAAPDGLADRLLRSGLVRRGPLGIGLDTTGAGRLRGADGDADAPLWTLGGPRRGTLWESTAFPEIRGQATDLAVAVRDACAARRPRDRFALLAG